MARACEICGKGHVVGHNVSHANNKTKRLFSPNLKSVRVTIEGTHRRIKVCTRCIRSGWIQKPPKKMAAV